MQLLLLALLISFGLTRGDPSHKALPVAKVFTTCPNIVPTPYSKDARAKRGTLLVVYKSMFRLGLYKDGHLVIVDGHGACFVVAMGQTPWKAKTQRDYASTPEGWYHVAEKRDVGKTMFYRGFLVDYPNRADARRALDEEIINESTYIQLVMSIEKGRLPSQSTPMGGSILLHGMGSEYPFWTAGCVALENEVMDILFSRVKQGDDILIVPWQAQIQSFLGGVRAFTRLESSRTFSIPVDPTPEDVYAPEAKDFIRIDISP